MKTKSMLVFAILFVTLLIGCEGGGGNNDNNTVPPPPTPPSIPIISLSTSTLNFTAQTGNAASAQSFETWNSGDGKLDYYIVDDASWLTENQTSGTSTGEHDTISSTASCVSLSQGNYSATITIIDNNASNSPQTINIALACTSLPTPSISRSPSSFNFTAQTGQTASAQTLSISNSGSGTLDYTLSDDVAWLTLSPTTGTSTGETDSILVTASCVSLSAGTYNGTITITDQNASNNPQTSSVSLICTSSPTPTISRSPSSFSFTGQAGQAGNTPDSPKTLSVSNSGSGTLNYSISDSATWLSESPTSGTSTGETDSISITASCSSLSTGAYNSIITISDPSASNNPQTSTVSLTCNAAPTDCSNFTDTLSIAVGGTYNGTLSTSDAQLNGKYIDDLDLTGAGGKTIDIDLTSSDFDTYLKVYDLTGGSCNIITQDDDSGSGTNSRISSLSVPSGKSYVIIATSFSIGSTGNYTLSVADVIACPTLDTNLASPADVSTCVSFTPFFDWYDTPNAGYYNLQICENEPCYFNSPYIVYDNTNVTASSFSLPSGYLTSSKVYYWRVRASNSSCPWAAWTEPFQFVLTTDCTGCPIGDGDLITPADGSTGITLTPSFDWYNVPNAAYYELEICKNNTCYFGSPDLVYSNSSIINSYFTLPSGVLTSGTLYYWRVRSGNSSCPWAAWSEPQSSFRTQ